MSGREGAVVAVVLAAGEASRFGAPKQALLLPCVLGRLEPLLGEETIVGIVVVEGAHPLEAPATGPRVSIVHCPVWAHGPGASLRCGLAALEESVDAVVVVLADGPDLSPDSVRRLVAAWRDGAADVVAASYGGVRGHPVVVGRPVWAGIPDEGLRRIRPALVPCDDLGAPGDVDTPADLPADLL